jgi:hypothetical protein
MYPDNISLQTGALNEATIASVSIMISGYSPYNKLEFGVVMEKLTEQLTHGNNAMVLNHGRLVAYAGWMPCREEDAKYWHVNGGQLPEVNHSNSNAVIVTFLVSADKQYLLPLVRAVSHCCAGKNIYRFRGFRRPPKKGHLQPFS